MLLFMIQQGGARYHPGPVNLLGPFVLVGFGVVAGALLIGFLDRVVPVVRRRWHAHRRRRRARHEAATAEQRARAMMSELCPHGWRADITVFEHQRADHDPAASDRGRVQLRWTELRDATGTPAVSRELWAETVTAALEAMVVDRRTDETLEAIEQGAVFEGARWPEPEEPAY